MNIKLIYLTLLLFFLSPEKSISGDENSEFINYGFFGRYVFDLHEPRFNKIDSVGGCCNDLTQKNGGGYDVGGLIEWKLPGKFLLGLRGSLILTESNFFYEDTTALTINRTDPIQGTYRAELNYKYGDFSFEPYLLFGPGSGIKFHIGARLGLTLRSDIDFVHKVLNPENALFFKTNTDTRNKFTGKLPGSSDINTSFFAGISYTIPVKSLGMKISPEAFYFFGTNKLARDLEWNYNSIRLGLSVKFESAAEKVEIPTEFKTTSFADTIKIENISVDKIVFRHGKIVRDTTTNFVDGKELITESVKRRDTVFLPEKPVAKISVNSDTVIADLVKVTESLPLLPYIFFKKDTDKFIDHYSLLEKTDDFTDKFLPRKPMYIQAEILNVIGYRLKKNPGAKIILRGFADSTSEDGSSELANKRSARIKEYLTKVWDIKNERITINTCSGFCSPPKSTQTQNERGFSENRRVEISADDGNILQPVIVRDFYEVESSIPDDIIVSFDGTKSKLDYSWTLNAERPESGVFRKAGKGKHTDFKTNLVNTINLKRPGAEEHVSFNFYIEDEAGRTSMDRKEVIIKTTTEPKLLSRMNLVLFDVGSWQLSKAAKKTITQFIKNMPDSAQFNITGYTDDLGDFSKNYRLSEQRVEATAKFIESIRPDLRFNKLEGVASAKFPKGINSYNTPIERFLSRVVVVEVFKK